MYDADKEQELLGQIETAKTEGDYDLMKTLMQDLIKLQKEFIPDEVSDETLANWGVDLQILERERELREMIKAAQQNGDFTEAIERQRELIRIQKLQPKPRGAVRYAKHR
jgi:hypothetical protein